MPNNANRRNYGFSPLQTKLFKIQNHKYHQNYCLGEANPKIKKIRHFENLVILAQGGGLPFNCFYEKLFRWSDTSTVIPCRSAGFLATG